MGMDELSQIYYINMEIKSIQQEVYELKQKNFYKKNIFSNELKRTSEIDHNLKYVHNLMQLEEMLNYNLMRMQEERRKIEEFLDTIEDQELRVIFRLRCVNNMNWEDIGMELNMDRRTASRKFFKYFKDLKKE
jgi:hypothetical protein